MKVLTWCPALAVTAALGASMTNSNDLVNAIAKRLGWPASQSYIKKQDLHGLHACEIYFAHDMRSFGGGNVGVARLQDGSLVAASDANALNNVFAKCASSDTPADTLAELLVHFSEYAGLVVLHDNSLLGARLLLKQAGLEFSAPKTVVHGDKRVVSFFALSLDGSALVRVEGHLDKPVTIKVEQLASQ